MLKPNGNYKMCAQHKRFLARILDPHQRGIIKRSLIQADLYAAQQPRRDKKNHSDNSDLT